MTTTITPATPATPPIIMSMYWFRKVSFTVKVLLISNSSTKSRFIAEKIGQSDVKYIPVKSDDIPSFILSDQQERLNKER